MDEATDGFEVERSVLLAVAVFFEVEVEEVGMFHVTCLLCLI